MLGRLADIFIVAGGFILLAYVIAHVIVAVIEAIKDYNNQNGEGDE